MDNQINPQYNISDFYGLLSNILNINIDDTNYQYKISNLDSRNLRNMILIFLKSIDNNYRKLIPRFAINHGISISIFDMWINGRSQSLLSESRIRNFFKTGTLIYYPNNVEKISFIIKNIDTISTNYDIYILIDGDNIGSFIHPLRLLDPSLKILIIIFYVYDGIYPVISIFQKLYPEIFKNILIIRSEDNKKDAADVNLTISTYELVKSLIIHQRFAIQIYLVTGDQFSIELLSITNILNTENLLNIVRIKSGDLYNNLYPEYINNFDFDFDYKINKEVTTGYGQNKRVVIKYFDNWFLDTIYSISNVNIINKFKSINNNNNIVDDISYQEISKVYKQDIVQKIPINIEDDISYKYSYLGFTCTRYFNIYELRYWLIDKYIQIINNIKFMFPDPDTGLYIWVKNNNTQFDNFIYSPLKNNMLIYLYEVSSFEDMLQYSDVRKALYIDEYIHNDKIYININELEQYMQI